MNLNKKKINTGRNTLLTYQGKKKSLYKKIFGCNHPVEHVVIYDTKDNNTVNAYCDKCYEPLQFMAKEIGTILNDIIDNTESEVKK